MINDKKNLPKRVPLNSKIIDLRKTKRGSSGKKRSSFPAQNPPPTKLSRETLGRKNFYLLFKKQSPLIFLAENISLIESSKKIVVIESTFMLPTAPGCIGNSLEL